jgi:hypothetical protein
MARCHGCGGVNYRSTDFVPALQFETTLDFLQKASGLSNPICGDCWLSYYAFCCRNRDIDNDEVFLVAAWLAWRKQHPPSYRSKVKLAAPLYPALPRPRQSKQLMLPLFTTPQPPTPSQRHRDIICAAFAIKLATAAMIEGQPISAEVAAKARTAMDEFRQTGDFRIFGNIG